jgi:spermidine synthase
MVDIDGELIDAVKEHLPEMSMGSFNDPRVKLILSDGRKYLEEHIDKFDAIILDLVDPTEGGPAVKLYTLEFYQLVKKRLNDNGIMVTQATSPVLTPRTFAIIRNTLAKVFRIVRPYITYVRSYNGLWGFIAASDHIDPANLTAEHVTKRIRERVNGELRFYDGQTHEWMFSIPKPIREMLKQVRDIATDNNPVYVPV